MMQIDIIPILADNYSYILTSGDDVAVIDPGDGQAMIYALQSRGLTPNKIFITHHHSDHIAGIADIKKTYGCTVYGPAAEDSKIPGLDHKLHDGDVVFLGDEEGRVIATPGHTLGHIVFWFPHSGVLFAGDTLFSLGCGRLLEGAPEHMYASLSRLKDLPDETQLYCGHEYTQSNAAFLLAQEPDNTALHDKMDWVKKQRANNQPTLPSLLGEEKKLNGFLTSKNAEAFAALRRLKDQF